MYPRGRLRGQGRPRGLHLCPQFNLNFVGYQIIMQAQARTE